MVFLYQEARSPVIDLMALAGEPDVVDCENECDTDAKSDENTQEEWLRFLVQYIPTYFEKQHFDEPHDEDGADNLVRSKGGRYGKSDRV